MFTVKNCRAKTFLVQSLKIITKSENDYYTRLKNTSINLDESF